MVARVDVLLDAAPRREADQVSSERPELQAAHCRPLALGHLQREWSRSHAVRSDLQSHPVTLILPTPNAARPPSPTTSAHFKSQCPTALVVTMTCPVQPETRPNFPPS